MNTYFEQLKQLIIDYAPKVLSALIILIIGLIAIRIIVKLVKKIMQKRGVDQTLQKFLGNLLSWTLNLLLFITVISKLGVATTSFAAVIAAAGLAIGLALQGSLSNFAGGTLIMLFKPFKVGDLIEAQGELGVVKNIQIFTTQLVNPTNKLVILPNGALSNGNIINYSAEGQLRVDLTIGIGYDEDIKAAKTVLIDVMNNNPKVLQNPAPTVNVSELADSSINLAVRPWCAVDDYWDVYFGTLEACKEALDKAEIEIPYPHQVEIRKS